MAGAGARHAARDDLPALTDESTDPVEILVINGDNLFLAKAAGFAAGTAEAAATTLTALTSGTAFASGTFAPRAFEFGCFFHFRLSLMIWYFRVSN